MTPSTKTRNQVVFLLDVDNTLLDNDRVTAELESYLTREFGADCQERYRAIFEALRSELGYADSKMSLLCVNRSIRVRGSKVEPSSRPSGDAGPRPSR